ncbi:MAG: hypothetical protein CVU38_19740 [Chloroflexi bacterium HGW-Chloroflexi-1]|nr:MAG: hypothetical protein CVU38_19740 [Chloroflexi bacterium HGW-Chloroflexi-1]
MSTTEERMRILKMIAEKQITAEEGAKLLEALRASGGDAAAQEAPTKARWLRVRVTDRGSGRAKLSVNIPIGLLDVGLKMGARFAPDLAGMDMQAIQAAIKEGLQGRIMEVDDEEDDERVEIFVE